MAAKTTDIQTGHAQAIQFEAKLFTIGSWTILRLPESASAQLPSRGQAMVVGSLNDVELQTPLEPDGKGSHWFTLDSALIKAAHVKAGDTAAMSITPLKDWPEPEIPSDLWAALAAAPEALAVWQHATPMAHWEWIRWIRSTGRDETHQRRIEVGISKLGSGERRPCCWNRNLSTEPSVSKNGVLLDPTSA